MAHLVDRLPWTSLARAVPPNRETCRLPAAREAFLVEKKRLAVALADAVDEFAAKDTRSASDKERYDIVMWPNGLGFELAFYGATGLQGYVPTVIHGYVMLDVVAADESRLRHVIFPNNGHSICPYDNDFSKDRALFNGSRFMLPWLTDYGLPEWLIEKARQVHTDHGYGPPVPVDGDDEALLRLHHYCAELFQVIYTRPDLFSRGRIAHYVERFLF